MKPYHSNAAHMVMLLAFAANFQDQASRAPDIVMSIVMFLFMTIFLLWALYRFVLSFEEAGRT